MAYAKTTDVPVDRSRSEIEKTLAKYGARGFYYAAEDDRAMVGFKVLNDEGKMLAVRMTIDLPGLDEFETTPAGRTRPPGDQQRAKDQAHRSHWRALLLIIKAKLEAVSLGVTTIEREFMPDIMMPNGQTIGEMVAAQRPALEAGGQLKLLPGGRR